MNTKRAQPATQKAFFKASRNTMSKNNVKLDSLAHQSHPNSDGGKTNKPKNTKALQKLEKVQSDVLKNLKSSSHQISHEAVCDFKNERANHFELTTRPSNTATTKQQQKSVENKTGTSKSFTFRVKNLSCYKKVEDCSKFAQAIQQVMEEIAFGDTLQFKGKVTVEKKSNSDYSSEENQFQFGRQSIRGPLQASEMHHPNSMKVKPVVCRDPKRRTKLITEGQNQGTAKVRQEVQNRLNESGKMNIECILKKFKKISKHEEESSSNFKLQLVKNEQPQDHFYPLDTKVLEASYCLNLEKSKGFNGCRTIRVPWSQNKGLSDNEIVGRHIKRLETSLKRKSQQQMQFDRDDVFGGISSISKKQSPVPNAEGVNYPLQSLKQLFRELRSGAKDEEEFVSKGSILE